MEAIDAIGLLGPKRCKDVQGIGKVKYYVNRSDKKFGFIESEFGDIYIHGSRAYEFAPSDDEYPILVPAATKPDKTLMYPPKRNNSVLFIAESKDNKFRAVRWILWDEEEFEAILKTMDDRPTYRLVQRKGHKIQSKLHQDGNSLTIKWQGNNLSDLRNKFPKNYFRVEQKDDRALFFENEKEGTWEPCGDPR